MRFHHRCGNLQEKKFPPPLNTSGSCFSHHTTKTQPHCHCVCCCSQHSVVPMEAAPPVDICKHKTNESNPNNNLVSHNSVRRSLILQTQTLTWQAAWEQTGAADGASPTSGRANSTSVRKSATSSLLNRDAALSPQLS